MNIKFGNKLDLLIIRAILCLVIWFNNQAFSKDKTSPPNRQKRGCLILIMIDYHDFFCPLCLESVQDFCDLVHLKGLESVTSGVLVIDNEGDREDVERQMTVLEKRLRGFIAGNNIHFPIILDRFHVLAGFRSEGSSLILFDYTRKIIRKFSFPLAPEQLDEILLSPSRGNDMKAGYWPYIGITLLGLVFFMINMMKYQAQKKVAGEVHGRWSSTFNLGLPAGRIRWALLIVAIAGIVYFFLSEPQARGNYSVVVIGILVFSQYPRWNVLVGSRGLVMGTKFIPWERMIEKNIIENGKTKRLEFAAAPESDPSKLKSIKIRIPCGKCGNIRDLLKLN